jgi:predicted phosphohydrolase
MTAQSNFEEVRDFLNWFGARKHTHEILAAGNHDRWWEMNADIAAALMPSDVEAIQPRLHSAGHIHSGRGNSKLGPTVMVNAAICDDDYRPSQPPLVIEL